MKDETNGHLHLRQLERWAPGEMSTRAKISTNLPLVHRCAFAKSSFATVPIFPTVHSFEVPIALWPNCLFHQNQFAVNFCKSIYPKCQSIYPKSINILKFLTLTALTFWFGQLTLTLTPSIFFVNAHITGIKTLKSLCCVEA